MILAILILLMPVLGPFIIITYFLLTILYKSIKLIWKIIITLAINLKKIIQERRRVKILTKARNLERINNERQKANEYKKLVNNERQKANEYKKLVNNERQKANEYKKLVNSIVKKFSLNNEPLKQNKINKNQLNIKKNFCNKCGAVFEEGSFKCSYCGTELKE